MKRLILATLLMLAISAFVVGPAFASETCAHDMGTHEPTVAALISHVQHANEMGHIKNALVPAFLAPLNAAANETLPLAARVGALQAFIELVNAQTGKAVHAECVSHLVMHAQHVIDALNAQA